MLRQQIHGRVQLTNRDRQALAALGKKLACLAASGVLAETSLHLGGAGYEVVPLSGRGQGQLWDRGG